MINTSKLSKFSAVAMGLRARESMMKYSGVFAAATIFISSIGGMAYVADQVQKKQRHNALVLSALSAEMALTQQISKNILLLQREWRDGQRINAAELSELLAARARFESLVDGLSGKAIVAEAPPLGPEHADGLNRLAKAFAPLGAQIDILGRAQELVVQGRERAGARGEWLSKRKAFSLVSTLGREDDVPNAFVNAPGAFKARQTEESAAAAAVSEQVTKTANAFNNYAGDLFAGARALHSKVGADIAAAEERDALAQLRIALLGAGLSLLALGYFVRRIVASHAVIDKSAREHTAMMQTIRSGLFLIDKDWNVLSRPSAYTRNIFGETFAEGSNLMDALSLSVGPDDLGDAKRFTDILCSRLDLSSAAIEKLNPLGHLSMRGPSGELHVGFHFEQVLDAAGRLGALLVSVADSTEQIKLKAELDRAVLVNKEQLKLLSVLADAPDSSAVLGLVVELMVWVAERVADIKQDTAMGPARVASMGALVHETHTYKGRARDSGLTPIGHLLHDLEETLVGATKSGAVSPAILAGVLARLSDILDALSVYRAVLGARGYGKEVQTLAAEIERVAIGQAHRSGKDIVFSVSSGAEDAPEARLPEPMRRVLRDALVHLVKNAVIHGIEFKPERVAAGKRPMGGLTLGFKVEGGFYCCSLFDDGRGVDTEALRQKLASMEGGEGRAAALSREELLRSVFNDGLSTLSDVDEDAGRGIGLAACKRAIEAAGGGIEVISLDGKGCGFKIRLPMRRGGDARL